jgi:hypothetical protein
MARERLYLFDTTLRDGAQTNGVDFTLADKLAIAGMLDELGLDYVEGGYPGANPVDSELFSAARPFAHATFTAFGMTRRPGRSASNDPGLAALLEAKAGAILADALEKLAGARGAAKLAVDASDTAYGFFAHRGYSAQQRNSVPRGEEWLTNTTMHKQLSGGARKAAAGKS